jgi:hypothetical protein
MGCADQCAYCGSSIGREQGWLREKIYNTGLNGGDPSYRRYHAEVFGGQDESCWEKYRMEREFARTVARAA